MSSHRYRVDACPDGPNHYLLRVPELDGSNGIEEVTGQCDNVADLESDAQSLIAAVLAVDPDTIDIEIRWDTHGRAVEICRDRVIRASEIRQQIGDLWGEYIDRYPRRFSIVRADAPDRWTLVLRTFEPMPTRLSTLFGEWLYELRAALDGIIYHLAVQDSGQNPPPAERGLMFPTFDDAAKFDAPSHRGRLQALSDNTFALLRHVQPFNAPNHHANVLWWLDELARIDRHRYGHALAPHLDRCRVGIMPPLQITQRLLPEPLPVLVDEAVPLPILELQAPAGWGVTTIQEHLDISGALNTFIDVPEWRARASQPMNSMDLSERMFRCEDYVLFGIVEPLASGDMTLTPEPEAAAEDSDTAR